MDGAILNGALGEVPDGADLLRHLDDDFVFRFEGAVPRQLMNPHLFPIVGTIEDASAVKPRRAKRFRVEIYDRQGHSVRLRLRYAVPQATTSLVRF
jgi:hypothetical protein